MSPFVRLLILSMTIAGLPGLASVSRAAEEATPSASSSEEDPASAGPTDEALADVDPDFETSEEEALVEESAARDDLEELIVTSTRRAESIQDVPISVTALSSQMLEDRGLTEFAELGNFVPNLQILPVTDTRSTSIRIRGIGSAGSNAGIDPSVGVFIDGVYQGRAGMSVGDLVDIERVEVLRGPQGTLYGKNTAAGAMSIVTKSPSYEREAIVETVFGNYKNAQVRGVLNIPLVEDRIATRISAYRVTRDGWSTNSFNGQNVNNSDKWGVRGKLAFDISDAFSIQLSGDYAQENPRSFVADIKTYYGPATLLGVKFERMAALPGRPAIPFADPFDQIVGANDTPVNKVVVGGAALDMLGDWKDHTIRWLTAWRTYETKSSFDGDFSIYDAVINTTNVDLQQISSELTFTSPGGGRYDYQAGLYTYYMDMKTEDFLTVKGDWVAVQNAKFPPIRIFNPFSTNLNANSHKTLSAAAYGEASYFFIEDYLKLIGGLRVTYEQKNRRGLSVSTLKLPNTAPLGGPDELKKQTRTVVNLQGKAVLQWYPFANSSIDVFDVFMVYGSVANGFKSGGFNQLRTGLAIPTEFNDEESLNYEIGLKTTWLDRRVTANLTGFYTDYDNFQAQTFNGSQINVVNAGRLISYGIEGEFNYLPPIDNLVLGSLLGWNITEYKDFRGAPNTITAARACIIKTSPINPFCNVQDLSGESLANAPRLTVTLFTQYEHELPWESIHWFARADYTYTSQVWLDQDLDDNLKQPSTNLLNLRTGFRADDDLWSITVWVDNVSDDRWLVAGFDVPVINGYAAVMAPPRHYGVTMRFKF